MANKRTWKKRHDKDMINAIGQMQEVMVKVEDVMKDVYIEQLNAKKNKEKKLILQIISIREMLAKDFRKNGVEAYPDLEKYIYEITGILEANDVEIIQCQQFDNWDSKIMEARKRIMVPNKSYEGKIYKVYGDGYKWKKEVIKPIPVEVLVCE